MKAYYSLFIYLTFISCERPSSEVVQVGAGELIQFKFDKISSETFNYEISNIVPLQTIEGNFLSDNIIVKFTNDFLFVLDEQVSDAIHKFDHDGNYLSQLISVGEDPQSVENISDFIVSGDVLEILVGKGAYSEIVHYSLVEEKITKVIKLEVLGFSFEKIDQFYYVYSSYNLPFAEYRVSKLNLHGDIVGNYLKNEYRGTMLPMVERNFFTGNGSTFLIESFNNMVFEVTKDTLKAKYSFDFGKSNVPKSFFESDIMTSFERLNNDGFYNIRSHFENKDIAFTSLIFQKENVSQTFFVILDKGSNEIMKFKISDQWEDVLKYPLGLTADRKLVFSVNPQVLLENPELIHSESALDFQVDDNPVLIYTQINI